MVESLKCESFVQAIVESAMIREIAHVGQKFRFNAYSPSDAASALEAIREICRSSKP